MPGQGKAEAVREILFGPVAEELAEVEERIRRGVRSRIDLVSEVSAYVLQGGGKRVRPVLLLLAAKMCGCRDTARSVELAVVAEYMHVATLIHDDIVDNADTRRGQASANARFGAHVSVLAGDFLYAYSIGRLVENGDFQVLKGFCDATMTMTEGEILEAKLRWSPDIQFDEYLTVITCKTAALFSAACRAGALVSEMDSTRVEALAEFGLNLGIGFQLVDDALDFSARKEILGKPVGQDLREGRITYPLIYVLRRDASPGRDRIRSLMERKELTAADVALIHQYVVAGGGVEATLGEANAYLTKAKGHLDHFPPSPAKRSLMLMADFIAERQW
ncbi:MAG: polyprenyl synthetase family protein [Candidatus Methylomirabilales bacterium]